MSLETTVLKIPLRLRLKNSALFPPSILDLSDKVKFQKVKCMFKYTH